MKADYLKEGDLKNSRVNLIENRSDKLKQQGSHLDIEEMNTSRKKIIKWPSSAIDKLW